MFTHIGTLTLTPEAGPRAQEAVASGLTALAGVVPGLRSVRVYPDAGLSEGNASLVFVAEFDDEAAWRAYGTHPAHVALVRDVITPVVAAKSFVQSTDDAPGDADDAPDSLEDDYAAAGFGGQLPPGRRAALLLVDPARAYTDPESPLYAGVDDAVGKMRELLALARANDVPVFLTRLLYRPDGSDGGQYFRKVDALRCFLPGNPFGEFIEGLEPTDGDSVIIKQYPSAFFGTPLASTLTAQGIDTLVIGGLSTSGCVRASTLDALQYGFVPLVVREAVGDRAKGPHESNLFDIAAKCGEVISMAAARDVLTAGEGAGVAATPATVGR
ncbi:MAG TPA: isochorismatase family protein [Thermopolyspora sp.]|jgi:Amidases related to nicotinamidase